MLETLPRYRSYLLTVWEERRRDPSLPAVWRFSLEDPHNGQRRGFADLEALTAALQDMVASEQGSQPHSAAEPGGQGRDPWADA